MIGGAIGQQAALALLAAGMLAGLAGCVPSEPVDSALLEEHWHLQADVYEQSELRGLELGERQLPTRWRLVQEESLLRSTASIVRAVDKLRSAEDLGGQIEIAISNEHAHRVADILARARRAVVRLEAMTDPEEDLTPEQWSARLAGALVTAEEVARLATAAEPGEPTGDEPLGWSAGPILQMLSGYLQQHAGGHVLQDLAPDEFARVRQLLTQIVLRVGFSLAGKQDPPGLAETIAARLADAERPAAQSDELQQSLQRALAEAPPTPPDATLRNILRGSLEYAPDVLSVLEHFLRHWHRIDAITFELRELDDEEVVTVTLAVQPGEQVRMKRLVFMQPDLLARGTVRVSILPERPRTGQTVVQFEGLDDGAAELRFGGLGWLLVRMFGLPVRSAALREIRVSAPDPQFDTELLSVALILDIPDAEHPRRILTYQRTKELEIMRRAFDVSVSTIRKVHELTYLTPTARYRLEYVQDGP